jgi:hypothetical protein
MHPWVKVDVVLEHLLVTHGLYPRSVPRTLRWRQSTITDKGHDVEDFTTVYGEHDYVLDNVSVAGIWQPSDPNFRRCRNASENEQKGKEKEAKPTLSLPHTIVCSLAKSPARAAATSRFNSPRYAYVPVYCIHAPISSSKLLRTWLDSQPNGPTIDLTEHAHHALDSIAPYGDTGLKIARCGCI